MGFKSYQVTAYNLYLIFGIFGESSFRNCIPEYALFSRSSLWFICIVVISLISNIYLNQCQLFQHDSFICIKYFKWMLHFFAIIICFFVAFLMLLKLCISFLNSYLHFSIRSRAFLRGTSLHAIHALCNIFTTIDSYTNVVNKFIHSFIHLVNVHRCHNGAIVRTA